MREQEHEQRGTETDEHRKVRLQQMREQQHERRGAETDEHRGSQTTAHERSTA